jgi:hypothetical protein
MLAEKFFLVLETLLSRTFDDESAIVISSAAHISGQAATQQASTVFGGCPNSGDLWATSIGPLKKFVALAFVVRTPSA